MRPKLIAVAALATYGFSWPAPPSPWRALKLPMVQKAVHETSRTCVETERKPKEEECLSFSGWFESSLTVRMIEGSDCEMGRISSYLIAKDIRSEVKMKDLPGVLDLYPT
jgi:hypothetical protein